MKKTVKFISAICAIVMLLGILPVMSVSAADAATLVVTPSKEEVKAGKEFTVTVSIANNPGFGAIAFTMPIDTNAFEFVKAETAGTICPQLGMCSFDADNSEYKFNGLGDGLVDVTADGLLVTITLRAKAEGDYTFSTIVDAENTVGTFDGFVAVANGSASVKIIPNVPVSTIDSASVNLGTDISVVYYATLDEDHAGAQMKFTFNDEETVVDGVATGVENEYAYTFTGIAPQCMGDNIKADLIFNDAVVATKDGYSVLANCQNLLAESAAELGLTDGQYAAMETLIADLLVYGAKAQVYRSYKTDALVDADVTGATALGAISEDNNVKYTEGSSNDAVAFTAAGVFFDYANSLYYKFTAPEMTESNFKLAFVEYDAGYNVVNSVEYTLADCELIDEATSTYKFTTGDVSVLDYGTIYSVELYVKSGRNWGDPVQFFDYNVNSYAYAKQTSENPAMANLAKALYNYGVSAAAYLNA